MADSNSSSLASYKSNFLADCVSAEALKFGTVTLKSKRISPYFFKLDSKDAGHDLLSNLISAGESDFDGYHKLTDRELLGVLSWCL